MNPELPIIHDLVFVTAVDCMASSFRRTIHELTESSAHPKFGESAKQSMDVVADFFNQIKSDTSILDVKNANDVQKLLESYFLNNDYRSLIRTKTFELTSILGEANLKHLASHLSKSFALADASIVNTSVDPTSMATVLLNNPWLIMIIVSLFARVTDGPV
jgi:hypothetical protein